MKYEYLSTYPSLSPELSTFEKLSNLRTLPSTSIERKLGVLFLAVLLIPYKVFFPVFGPPLESSEAN